MRWYQEWWLDFHACPRSLRHQEPGWQYVRWHDVLWLFLLPVIGFVVFMELPNERYQRSRGMTQ